MKDLLGNKFIKIEFEQLNLICDALEYCFRESFTEYKGVISRTASGFIVNFPDYYNKDIPSTDMLDFYCRFSFEDKCGIVTFGENFSFTILYAMEQYATFKTKEYMRMVEDCNVGYDCMGNWIGDRYNKIITNAKEVAKKIKDTQ